MNSDEFLSTFLGALVAAALILGLLLAVFLTPLFLLAGAPAAAYIYHRNSPETKEKQARKRTEALYQQALAVLPPNVDAHADRMFAALEEPARGVAAEVYKLEGLQLPPPVPPICDSIEGARYRDKLIKYINTAEGVSDDFVDALIECMPKYPPSEGIFEAEAPISNKEVQDVAARFYQYDDYFKELKKKLDRNLDMQKGVLPAEYKGDNCAFVYLKDTPLLELEKRMFRIGLKARTEHMQIVAGSGSGKTNLLQYLIHHDLEDDCCIIVIDSQRQLINSLAEREIDTDKLAYFSPHHNLGLNLFDLDTQSEADAIAVADLMEYVLSSLMDAKLTSKQATVFNYSVQLLMACKGNLSTLRQILKKKANLVPFGEAIGKLPKSAQDFFVNEFSQQSYDSTKEEIMWRLDAMQRNPAFARIFDAPTNPVDMGKEMASRKLILIDTDVNYLGEAGSSFFGRLFIALILKASRQRFTGKHRPVYLYIDECAAYLDSRLELMLQQARKANIGVILAHQDLDQLRKAGILTTVLGNTATKFAGRLSDADAKTMASNMKTTHEFLGSLSRYHFALSQIGEQTCAITAKPITDINKRFAAKEMVLEMERRYGYVPQPAEPPKEEPPTPPKPKEKPDLTLKPSKRL